MSQSLSMGGIGDIARLFLKETSLELFWRMCLSRAFEQQVAQVYDTDIIKAPVYLSLGQESVAAALSLSFLSPKIFAQHRCHDLYLSYGGDMASLVDELLGRPTGCAKGMGGSASIHSPEIGMCGHDGLMGTQIPNAVGYAMATGKKTLAVMGDASAEEGYVLEALGYAATKKPPILFVCTDNGLSCLTPICKRRSWNMVQHATFGMPSIEISDDPWLIMCHVRELVDQLPAFVNIQTCRISSHANTSKERTVEPEWDRYQLVKKQLIQLGLGNNIQSIEKSTKEFVDKIWDSRLEIKQ